MVILAKFLEDHQILVHDKISGDFVTRLIFEDDLVLTQSLVSTFELEHFWVLLPVLILNRLLWLERVVLTFHSPDGQFVSADEAAALFDDSQTIRL